MTTAFEISSNLVDDVCSQDPVLATQLGIPGSDHERGDAFGSDGVEHPIGLVKRYRSLIQPYLSNPDPHERLAARVMVGEFVPQQAGYDKGAHFRALRHMASPFHRIRLTFEMMRADSPEAGENIVRTLETVFKPLGDHRRLLGAGSDAGIVSPRRQVESVIEQARKLSRDPASIDEVVARAAGGGDVTPALAEVAEGARSAYGEFADWMQDRYLPAAPGDDRVGPDRTVRCGLDVLRHVVEERLSR